MISMNRRKMESRPYEFLLQFHLRCEFMAWPHNLHVGRVYVSMWFPLKSEGEGTAVKKLLRNCLRNAENRYSAFN